MLYEVITPFALVRELLGTPRPDASGIPFTGGALGYFHELAHPDLGRFETVGPPFRIDGCDLGAERAASPLGSDAAAILRSYNFV